MRTCFVRLSSQFRLNIQTVWCGPYTICRIQWLHMSTGWNVHNTNQIGELQINIYLFIAENTQLANRMHIVGMWIYVWRRQTHLACDIYTSDDWRERAVNPFGFRDYYIGPGAIHCVLAPLSYTQSITTTTITRSPERIIVWLIIYINTLFNVAVGRKLGTGGLDGIVKLCVIFRFYVLVGKIVCTNKYLFIYVVLFPCTNKKKTLYTKPFLD